DAGTERAREYPGRDPTAAPAHAARRGEHDADNQPGLDHFAEDDDERAEHSLFRDDHALGGVRMKLAEELVTAGRQRSHAHQPCRFARNDLLDLERGALEFFGARILVADIDRDAFTRRHPDFLRLEGVVADDDVELLGDGVRAGHAQCRYRYGHYRS